MAVAVDAASTSTHPLAPDPAVTLGTAATPLRLLLAPDGITAALALAGGVLTVLAVDGATSPPTLAAGGGGGEATKGADSLAASPAVAAARRASTDLHRSSPGATAARAVVSLAGAVGGALATPGRALLGRGRGSSSGEAGGGAALSPSSRLPSVSLGSEVKCLAFDGSGRTLAAGCEDGVIRFFAWPALTAAGQLKPTSPADEAVEAALAAGAPPVPGGPRPRPAGTCDGVRDLDFAPGGDDTLVVVHESGGARLVKRDGGGGGGGGPPLLITHPPILACAAKAPPARRGVAGAGRPVIGRARFEVAGQGAPAPTRLLATVAAGGRGWVAAWAAQADGTFAPVPGRAGSVAALPSPATAFTLSACGSLAAAGSADGDVALVDPRSLALVRSRPGAHMVFVTALAFSSGAAAGAGPGGRPSLPALVSVSGDASAVVTRAGEPRRGVVVAVLVLLLLLLALALLASGHASTPAGSILAAVGAVVVGVRRAVVGGVGGRFGGVAGDNGEL